MLFLQKTCCAIFVLRIYCGGKTGFTFLQGVRIMLKNAILLTLAVAVSSSFAQQVKSKRGPINLTKSQGGGGVTCTAPFGEELNLLKREGDYSLVKAGCGQGWVLSSSLEKVAKLQGDKSMNIDDYDIVGWMDDPSAVFVLDDNTEDVDGVDLNRNFRELLSHTMDRERIEMRNGEN